MVAQSQESTWKTLGFAALVAFCCALIVSSVVHWLRPAQIAASSIEYSRAVLLAAGLADVDELLDDREIIDRFLAFDVRVVDFESRGFADGITLAGHDYRLAPGAEPDVRPRYIAVFLRREGGRVSQLVLPFFGQGMWSTIHGLVALEGDLSTVAGMVIHDHGETPGIGDRIQRPAWLDSWRGKRLYGPDGGYRFRIISNPGQDQAPHAVDAITGATVTVVAVDAALAEWFGSDGYAPVLQSLREARQ